MATNPQQESDVVLGIVNKAWPYNEAKPTVPAKLVIDTGDGTMVDIAFFNAWDDYEKGVRASPPRLGEQWAKIDLARDEGRRIQVICFQALVKGTDKQKFYDGRAQFVMGKGTSVKFLDAAPTAPTPAATPTEAPVAAVQAPQATGYAPASRQEQGLALGNSKTGGSALVAAYVTANEGKLPDAEWLRQAAACVNTYSTDLLSGVTLEGLAEESGVTLEELVAEESLGVVSVDSHE